MAEKSDKPQGIKREDPAPRPVEGTLSQVALRGKDPDKFYVWVSEINDPTMNPGSYLAQGYTFTQYDADGPKVPEMGYQRNAQGEHIKSYGCVLMECSKEHKAMLDAKGQAWADQVESTIRKRDVGDTDDSLSAVERAKMRGIVTGSRYGGDDRSRWGF